jgi:hypothetical protein
MSPRFVEDFENPLETPDRRPRRPAPKPRRPLTAWEQQAESWASPSDANSFSCCGVLYRYAFASDLKVGVAVHNKRYHE